MTCRICLEPGGKTFCKCKGTAGNVHEECLIKWLDTSHRDQCEICKHPFQRSTRVVLRPKCSCTDREVLVGSDTNSLIVVFLVSFFLSTVFMFTYIIFNQYIITNICWIVTNMICSVFMRQLARPINIFIVYMSFTTLVTAMVSTSIRTPQNMNTITFINMMNMCTLISSTVLWCIVWATENLFETTTGSIMVYSSAGIQQNVDTSVHTHKPEPPGSSHVTV